MIHEHVFYRKHKTSWSLRLDSEAGTIRVCCRKDLKAGVEILDMTPAQFAASGNGNGYEQRAFQSRMKLLEAAVSARPKPVRLSFPAPSNSQSTRVTPAPVSPSANAP